MEDKTILEAEDARAHFLQNIQKLNSKAVLVRQLENGRLETVFVSDGFAEMMECSVQEAMKLMNGMSLFKTTDPEDRPLVRSMFKNRVAFDGSTDLILQKITAKKNRIWCKVHYAFIDDFGEHYIYMTYSDINALKQYEERLRSTYATLGDNFYRLGEKTLALFRVNLTRDRFEEVKGKDLYHTDSIAFSYSEAIRQRALHYPIIAEQKEFLECFDKDALSAGYLVGRTNISRVIYSIRKDGHSCFIDFNAAVTRHPLTGDLIAFITEQECNSEKVKETLMDKILAQQFDMVCYLANGQYGVTIGDAGKMTKGNVFPTARNGSYQQYLQNQVRPVLAGDPVEKNKMLDALSLEAISEQLKKKEPYVVNIAIEMDGETYYKQFDFYNIDPEARFYILLKSDTTEIQKEHIAMNEQLQEALEAANQANVAKTAFLSSMSHEIRTPMNAIIGLGSLALSEPGISARTRSQLEQIESSARHLLGLINDILDMSRIESGRMVVRSEDFSFAEMIEQINTMIGSQCSEKGLTYEYEAPGVPDAHYFGDVLKIKQVLINILGNAVKFTDAPGTVRFRAQKTAATKGQVNFRFTITDTGIGMDADYLPKIFDPFSQEDATSTNRYGSTGLGLAITKNIVELMNGTILVESEKGVGSTFFVDLPLKLKAEDAPDTEAVPEGEPAEGDAGTEDLQKTDPAASGTKDAEHGGADGAAAEAVLAGKRILLAEDMFINAEIMKELLKMRGMEVEHAENGRLAVDLFEERPAGHFDAVLMDLRMPVMDGLTAAETIRASARADGKTIPIIALTANAFEEDVQRSLRAGMNAHLSKPVEPDVLFKTLAEYMN